jgi:hypothetical protein
MAQIIPLDNSPNQTLAVAGTIDGQTLRLILDIGYNEMAQYWVMSISDASGNLLLSSVPMITGDWPAANLLAQYGYLKIGSMYVINVGQAENDYPDSTGWEGSFQLLWDNTA